MERLFVLNYSKKTIVGNDPYEWLIPEEINWVKKLKYVKEGWVVDNSKED